MSTCATCRHWTRETLHSVRDVVVLLRVCRAPKSARSDLRHVATAPTESCPVHAFPDDGEDGG